MFISDIIPHYNPTIFDYYQLASRPTMCYEKIIDLKGFNRSEVKIDSNTCKEDGKIHIQAEHEPMSDSDEYLCKKLIVTIPEKFDRESPKIKFVGNNQLMIQANSISNDRSDHFPTPRNWMSEFRNLNYLDEQMRIVQNQLIDICNNSRPGSMFPRVTKNPITGIPVAEMEIDLLGFKPDEINVKLDKEARQVTVEAKHDSSCDDNSTRRMKHIFHQFFLPGSADLEQMKSNLMPDGRLKFEMPCIVKELQPNSQATNEIKQIPISIS